MLAACAFLGFFTPFDGFIYDAFVRHSPSSRDMDRKVLLIDVPVAHLTAGDIDWEALVAKLADFGARQVIFMLAPALDTERLGRLLERRDVVVSAAVEPDPDKPNEYRFIAEQGMNTAVGASLPAVAAILDPVLGVHRYQRFSFLVDGMEIPSLEALAARRTGTETREDGRFMVNFSGQHNPLPRLSLDQALGGSLIRDIVQGRVVMVGPALDRLHRSVVTPITAGSRQVSELEYHGFALDSLLRGAAVEPLLPISKSLIVLAVWALCFLLVHSKSFRMGMVAASALGLAIVLGAWMVLLAVQVHVPVVAAILVLGTTVVSIFQHKGQQQNRQLSQLANETTLQVSGRFDSPASGGTGFWLNVMAMLDQMLPLTRAVLLTRGAEPGFIGMVQTLRCNPEVVRERRRDYRRAPYSAALDRNASIEVRDFLDPGPEGETQMLVPLRFDGEVQGFLALGQRKGSGEEQPALMRIIRAVTDHLSELLFERRRAEERDQPTQGWQDKLSDPRDKAIHILSQNVRLLSRHTAVLQDMVDSLEAATAIYDLFGRTLVVNAKMKVELTRLNFNDGQHTAADLLTIACEISLDEARSVIARVILDRHSIERTARLGERTFLLLVSALRDTSSLPGPKDDPLGNIHGLMFQLFATSHILMREPPGADAGIEGQAEPVDVWHAVEQAVSLTRANPALAHVAFNIKGAHDHIKANAPFAELNSVLGALLQLLGDDTREPGLVTIVIHRQPDAVVIQMRNNGFGMPNEKLQRMLSGPQLPQSPLLRLVREMGAGALGPQGRLQLYSEVGTGYAVRMQLELCF